jgi:beta-glucanase (GH16 family)
MMNITLQKIHTKLIIRLGLLVAAAAVIFSCSPDDKQQVTTKNNLVWQDEFSVDGAPDPLIWGADLGNGEAQGIPGWGNEERQYYTDRPENVVVENGMLKITALKESFQGSDYTSGRVLTKGKYQKKFGRFEARIKLPWGQGLWPAFWMLGDDSNGAQAWPQIGEIDIMEYRGQEPTIVHGSMHGPGYSGGQAITKQYDLVTDRLDTDFHVYGIEWGPGYVNYYIDEVLYNQITPEDVIGDWVFDDHEFYIIMNVAVGGTFVGAPGLNTVYPQTMYVDYVRVYE